MALVNYVSSDEDDRSDTEKNGLERPPASLKRKLDEPSDLPPLPSKFHDLYASNTRVSSRDDPTLHGGRTRATPHVEGNWPTHVYIEWFPTIVEHDSLNSLISAIKNAAELGDVSQSNIHSFLKSDLDAPLPLHVSLSRPIGFSTAQKDPFLTSLINHVGTSGVRPFVIGPCGLDWVANFESTRWFLVLRLAKPENDSLNRLLKVCNRLVEEYSQKPLYSDASDVNLPATQSPRTTKSSNSNKRARSAKFSDWDVTDFSSSFHISIGWTLERPDADLINATKRITEQSFFLQIQHTRIQVEEIKAKIGNVVTSIGLSLNAQEGRGILGS